MPTAFHNLDEYEIQTNAILFTKILHLIYVPLILSHYDYCYSYGPTLHVARTLKLGGGLSSLLKIGSY